MGMSIFSKCCVSNINNIQFSIMLIGLQLNFNFCFLDVTGHLIDYISLDDYHHRERISQL